MPEQGFWRPALGVSLVSGAGRALGLLQVLVIAALFGRGEVTDAWFFALSVPFFVSLLATNALCTSYAPLLAGAKKRGEAGGFAGRALFRLGALLAGLCLALGLVGPRLVAELAHMSPAAEARAAGFLLTLLPALWLRGCTALLRQTLEIHERFLSAAVGDLTRGGLGLAVLVVSTPGLGILALPLALAAGEAAGVVWQILALAWGRVPVWGPAPREGLRALGQRLGPLAAGELAVALSPVVDKVFAARLSTGAVGTLEYADRLRVIPETLLGLGILAVALSRWSAAWAERDTSGLKNSVGRLICQVCGVAAPLVAAATLARRPLVALLYGHGSMGAADQAAVADVLGAYLPGVIPLLAAILLARLLVVVGQARAMLLQGLISATLNLGADAVLAPRWGVVGLAWATSFVSLAMALVLAVLVGRAGLRLHPRHIRLGLQVVLPSGLVLAANALGWLPGSLQSATLVAGIGLGWTAWSLRAEKH